MDDDIGNFTGRLIQDYREREASCDQLLSALRVENRSLRRKGKTLGERMEVISKIRVLEAQKIAYVQARMDIASIEDVLGV